MTTRVRNRRRHRVRRAKPLTEAEARAVLYRARVREALAADVGLLPGSMSIPPAPSPDRRAHGEA